MSRNGVKVLVSRLEGPVIKRAFRQRVIVMWPWNWPVKIDHPHLTRVSTAGCERGFSTTNVIATKSKNRLLVKTITNLLVSPPYSNLSRACKARQRKA